MVALPADGYPLAYGDATITLDLGAAARLELSSLNAHFARRAVSLAWKGWRVVEGLWPNPFPGRASFSRVPIELSLSGGILGFGEDGISWTFWPEPHRVLRSHTWPYRRAGLEVPERPIAGSLLPVAGRIHEEHVNCDDGYTMVVELTPERLNALLGLEAEAKFFAVGGHAPRCFVLEDRFGARLYAPAGDFVPLWTRELRIFADGVDWLFCRQDLVHVWSRRVGFAELLLR